MRHESNKIKLSPSSENFTLPRMYFSNLKSVCHLKRENCVSGKNKINKQNDFVCNNRKFRLRKQRLLKRLKFFFILLFFLSEILFFKFQKANYSYFSFLFFLTIFIWIVFYFVFVIWKLEIKKIIYFYFIFVKDLRKALLE